MSMNAHRRLGCLILLVLAAGAMGGEAGNLVANGDFSRVSGGKIEGWQTSGDTGSVTQVLSVAKDADGRAYAQLACSRFESKGPSSHAMLAQVGMAKLVRGRMYEFSCLLRGREFAAGAVNIAITDTATWTNAGLQGQAPVTSQWRPVRMIFRAGRDVDRTSRLQLWFTATGTLHIADVRLAEVRIDDVELTDVIPPAGGTNLLPNSSFELGSSGWSSLGAGAGWGNLDALHGAVMAGDAPHGRSFLRIPMGGEHTPVLHFDYYQPVVRRELRPAAGHRGWIQVEKDARYTLSCFIRASVGGTRAVLGVKMQDATGRPRTQEKQVNLTTNWQRYLLPFTPGYRYASIHVGPDLSEEQRVDVDIDAIQLEKAAEPTEYRPRAQIEWSIEPGEPAGIFAGDKPAAIVVNACNHGDAAAKLTLRLSAHDFGDAAIPLPEQVVDLPARSAARQAVNLPAEWKGFYRIKAAAQPGGREERAELRVAIVPARRAKDSVLGINHAFATSRLIHLASKAGVTWYRDWSLKWEHIEPQQGQFRWEIADAQIDRVLKEGASALPLLPPFPSANWASEAPATLSTSGYPGVRIKQAWAPKDPRDLAKFIELATVRYKDRIRVWEFLNEPIYTDYALPADTTNRYGGRKYAPADYVALLKVASDAMRKADPACKVIGGIGGWPHHLTREVIEAGALQHLDIFNLHMYPDRRAPETIAAGMDELLKRMEAHGGRKPIWITEFSYYAADNLPRRPHFPLDDSWAESRLLTDEKQCADYTVRYFAVMLSRGVEKIFIHSGASPTLNGTNFECCLFDYGGAPRKTFAALAVMTDLLGPSPKPLGHRPLANSQHMAGFACGERDVVMLWQDERGTGATVKRPAGAEALLDSVGRPVAGGEIAVSPSPVYLLCPRDTAGRIMDAIAKP